MTAYPLVCLDTVMAYSDRTKAEWARLRRTHFIERVEQRLPLAGFDSQARADFVKAADATARAEKATSAAYRFKRLPHRITESAGVGSVGSDCWLIVRGGECHTVMFRERWESVTPAALKVSKVYLLDREYRAA